MSAREPPTLAQLLRRTLRPGSRRYVALGALVGVCGSLADGLVALGLLTLVQSAPERRDAVWVLVAGAVLRVLAQSALQLVSTLAQVHESSQERARGLDRVLAAGATTDEPATEALTRWIETVPKLAQLAQATVVGAALVIQGAVVSLVVVWLAPIVGTLALLALLLTAAALAFVSWRARDGARALAPAQRAIVAHVTRVTQSLLLVRALRTEHAERARLVSAVDAHASRQRALAWRGALSGATLVPAIVALGAGIALTPGDTLPTHEVIAATYGVLRLAALLQALASQVAAAATARFAEPQDAIEQTRRPVARSIERVPPSITLVDAALEARGRMILAPTSLRVVAGELVGIGGPSGAGKTTLLQLVAGALQPTRGAVRVDDRTAHEWLDAGGALGVVLAEPFVGPGTLREVIANGRAIDDAAILRALGQARAEALLEGDAPLERRVGEGGRGLSRGEQQRVALARALAGRPALLLLDEVTSGLDAALEDEMAEVIRGLRGEVTTLLVSHREPVLARCDRVFDVVPREGGATVVERHR